MAAAEASSTTVRTVIAGPGGAADVSERLDAAAGMLNGFEGVALDAEAEAAIRAALEACAARARAIDAGFDEGGEAAADAAEANNDSFVRVGDRMDAYRGTLVPVMDLEDYEPFTPGEAPWSLAGAQVPPELAQFKAEQAAKAAEEAEGRPGN